MQEETGFGNVPNTVSKSTALNTKLSEVLSSPKKTHKHKEMGPQNWTLDPTPKTPLDPPPLEILYALYSAGKTNTCIKNLGA